jgi:aminomuconate-semialdehyde/2-hydroxymuconate-6-semialdehyde dehydrogenase
MHEIKNYIGGKFIPALGGRTLENVDPSTGEVSGSIPASGLEDVELAVNAAEEVFLYWSTLPSSERSRYLLRISELIHENLDVLAAAESSDNGKPLWLAKKVDIPRAVENFEFFGTAARHFASESHAQPDMINYTLRKPVGIVGCISPWNLPLYLFSWKIAPALAAGNCVIAKPSEVTPLTAFLLSELCEKAGLPPGVLNVVHGTGPEAGAAIVAHPAITAVSFTGSTRAGKEIAAVAAPMFKKLSLELGGKNPNIIFADCDFEKALHTTLSSSFANQGQICLCGSRILVERPLYEKFRDAFVEKVRRLKVGDPADPETKQGALVSRPHFEKVLSCIALAREEGGRVLCGGEVIRPEGRCENGYFIAPAVIENLLPGCRTNLEEIFGPVVTIMPFDTEEEALSIANSTEYGLAGTIWTQDISRAHRVADGIKSGIIWVNCWLERDLRTPFGGMKNSGVGREGGWEALRFFTEPKNVCVKW